VDWLAENRDKTIDSKGAETLWLTTILKTYLF